MGFGELLVVLVIAVIFLGPDKIPETARTLGKWFNEIKSSLDDIKNSMQADLDVNEKPKSAPSPPPTSSEKTAEKP